jgi:hypothetical protein
MKTNNFDFPDYTKITNELRQLIQMADWKKYSTVEQIPKQLEEPFKAYFMDIIVKLPHFIKPNLITSNEKFFRVRKADTYFNENLISEYGAPPVSFSHKAQRANLPFHPVFYCSLDPITSINETIKPNQFELQNEDFYLAQWSFKENSKLSAEFYTTNNFNPNINEIKLIDWFEKIILNKLDSIPEFKEPFNKLRDLLSYLFVIDETYIFSSNIAHNVLYLNSNKRADLLFYPSIATEKRSLNIAIHPNTVDQNMTLDKIYKFNIKFGENQIDDKYNLCFNYVGQNLDGVFKWLKLNQENSHDLLRDILPFFKEKQKL